jgi:hypothetical protein
VSITTRVLVRYGNLRFGGIARNGLTAISSACFVHLRARILVLHLRGDLSPCVRIAELLPPQFTPFWHSTGTGPLRPSFAVLSEDTIASQTESVTIQHDLTGVLLRRCFRRHLLRERFQLCLSRVTRVEAINTTRRTYPQGVTDEEWAFVLPYCC